jgi:DNA-binding transcriptional LysR family regulator
VLDFLLDSSWRHREGSQVVLNTNRLKILREVAVRGSIAAAARALYLTGPAVSHQLATLEREVGVPLLERNPHSVRLTEAGVYLAGRAAIILADCEEALAGVESFSDEVRGTVRVSMNTLAGKVLLHAVLESRTKYPQLRIMPVSVPTSLAIPGLRTGEFDMVLSNDWDCLPIVSGPDTDRHDLMTEPCTVVLPRSHPLASSTDALRLADLADEEWCLSAEEATRHAVLLAMRAAGFEPRVAYEPNYPRSIARGAEAGLGIGIVPRSADLRGLDVVIRPLDEPALTRHLFALVRAGSSDSPAIRVVLNAIRKGVSHIQARYREGIEPQPAV